MAAAASLGFSTATDLADWLVQHAKLPFREAHHATGRIVKAAEKAGLDLAQLPLATMKKIEPRVTAGVFGVLDPAKSAASRRSFGGTAPEKVREAAETWLKTLESEGSSG